MNDSHNNTAINTTLAEISSDFVTIKDQRAMTTSLKVAQGFEKRHDNVLRDIQNLGCSEEFSLLNFEQRDYVNERGQTYPMIEMTRDGFAILAMSYTGAKAMKFKEEYIAAFNYMENLLRHDGQQTKQILDTLTRQIQELVAGPSTMSPVGMFVRDRCVVRADAIIMKSEIYGAYQYYSLKNWVNPFSRSRFFNSLYLTVGGVKSVRRTVGAEQISCVTGICLRKIEEAPAVHK